MVLWTFTVVSEESREFHKILRLPWLGTFACKIVWVTFIRPQFLLLINPQFPVLIVAVHLLSSAQLFVIPWTAAHQASLSYTISHGLLKLMSIELVVLSNHLNLCHPLLLLPSILPSIRVFSSELALHIRWPKYWSFSFSISPSNEYSGLIFFSIDWFDLLVVQGTLKSLLQHHSSKASILWHSAFFGFPSGSEVKVHASNAGDSGSIPGSGRSPGEGYSNPLQCSCLENPMDGEAW